jgi:hypothetical protein
MADALHISIYEEHLQELSFLYEHWRHALVDWQLGIEDRVDLERRCEAHLDGLMVGGGGALDICRRQAVEGDSGELYAAVRVLCRSDCADEVMALGSAVDWEDPERALAFSDALAHELPVSWTQKVATWLEQAPSGLAGALARAAAHRGLALSREVAQRAQKEKPPDVLPLLWALGMMGSEGSEMLLYRYMQQPQIDVGRTAAIAGLRLGTPQVREYLLGSMDRWSWSAIPAALCGDQRIGQAVSATVRNGGQPDALVALGILGDSRQIGMLLSCLTDRDLASSAALALYLITGADLSEEFEVPLEADEEDEEHDRGFLEERITEDPGVWQVWWDTHGERFRDGVRYRLGVPFAPQVTLRCLEDHRIPLQVRQWLADELAVRYAVDVPFAPDMLCAPYSQLARAVQAMDNAPTGAAAAGRWAVAGAPA